MESSSVVEQQDASARVSRVFPEKRFRCGGRDRVSDNCI